MMYDDNSEYSGEYGGNGGNDEYQSGKIQQDFSAEPADPVSGIEESADVVSSVTGLKKNESKRKHMPGKMTLFKPMAERAMPVQCLGPVIPRQSETLKCVSTHCDVGD